MIRSKIRPLLAVLALLSIGAVGTMSLLSDTSTTTIDVSSAEFGIEVNGSTSGTFTVDINAENLKPGESRPGDITVVNRSSVPAVVSLSTSPLTVFTSSVQDSEGDPFTSTTLGVGESIVLDLTIGLPSEVTESPAAQQLTLTFTAEQE